MNIFSWTLEDWNAALQIGSFLLLGLTFAIGGGAIITSYILSKRHSEKMVELEIKLAEQQERAANAEKTLLQLQETLFKPRRIDWEKSINILRGHPTGSAEIRYVPDNQEAFMLAIELFQLLSISGWTVPFPRAGSGMLPGTGIIIEVGADSIHPANMPHFDRLVELLDTNLKNVWGFGVRANQFIPVGSIIIIVGPKF